MFTYLSGQLENVSDIRSEQGRFQQCLAPCQLIFCSPADLGKQSFCHRKQAMHSAAMLAVSGYVVKATVIPKNLSCCNYCIPTGTQMESTCLLQRLKQSRYIATAIAHVQCNISQAVNCLNLSISYMYWFGT